MYIHTNNYGRLVRVALVTFIIPPKGGNFGFCMLD